MPLFPDAQRPFYITDPIFYPNANLHMGHAYSTVFADVLARYNRFRNRPVYFLVGADENTEKVARAAKSAGVPAKEYLDGIVGNFKKLFGALRISYDQFIRTSDERVHWPGAVALWRKIAENGDLEKRSYEGLYCIGHEAFITEKDLVNGKCPDHDEAPQRLREENYFFRLSRYGSAIRRKIESGELEILPEKRKKEILALLGRGLEDVSFSRPAEKLSVGIAVPGDPSQKMYVWCDALASYISALGFGSADRSLYETFWPAAVHVIGKDILRFHAAIWPAMLLSAGLPLPKKIFVHGFITSGGRKMSKTLGNVIDPMELIAEYGSEAVRYYLVRHISPFEDGDITRESFRDAYNGNLANGLGNLTSRIIAMAVNNGVSFDEENAGRFSEGQPAKTLQEKESAALEACDIKSAADAVWEAVSDCDQMIQKEEPFKKVKSDAPAGKEIIRNLLSRLYFISAALEPIMPDTAAKIHELIKGNKMPGRPLFPRKG